MGVGTVVFAEVLGRTLGGRPLLSARRLFRRVAWHRVRQIKQLNVPIKVKIFEWNAGGLLSRIEGLRAFLPKPEMMIRPRNFTELKNNVGQQNHVCITRIDERTNELIISEKEAWAMTYLREGTLLQGTVRKLFPYGAQIRIGETNRGGLLHISNITHGQLTSVGDVLKVGERVKALVIKSTAPDRIALSIKDLESEPGLFLSNKEKVFSEAEEMAQRYRDQISETSRSDELDSLCNDTVPFDDEAQSYANWKWLKFSKSDKVNCNSSSEPSPSPPTNISAAPFAARPDRRHHRPTSPLPPAQELRSPIPQTLAPNPPFDRAYWGQICTARAGTRGGSSLPGPSVAPHGAARTRMNSAMDEINLLRQAQRQHQHHLVVRGIGEEIDLEIGPGDDPSFSGAALVGVTSAHDPVVPTDDHKSLLLPCSQPGGDGQAQPAPPHGEEHEGMLRLPVHAKKKKKVVKKWREEWADTYKWAYVAVRDNISRIFCTVCKEYGRKHRRNPYGNEGSRNMQMSALEEHNNSLLHKEALRLQMASKEKLQPPEIERPVYVKALSKTAASILESVLKRDPHEAEFIQSIQEVVHSLEPVLVKNSQYVQILERLLEPERCFIFRVPWIDDRGEAHVNRGFRVQFSQALGPCRGGLRFHPSMNLSVAKFLAFEQTLKNALSLYKLGGAAGGSDFDPKGKSESEIMRFCQSFMDELYRYLGPDQDFPAEDVGVGPREMGYLFGQYRRLSGHFQGNFTGPKIFWSGSSFRTEATGYGLVFFARVVLADMNKELKGLRCVISGSGKIAMHVFEKLLSCEAIPVTVSDSKGYLLDGDGFDYVKYSLLRNIKAQQRSLKEYLKSYPHAKYIDDAKPWSEQYDVAFPCASENEIDQGEALAIINSGCRVLIECSNMPCTVQAVDILRKGKVLVAPAKATAAGGVAVGELELNPEFSLMQWTVEDFENKIQDAIKQTYDRSIKAAQDHGILKENPESLVHGANVCAFLNIAQAMTDQGCV